MSWKGFVAAYLTFSRRDRTGVLVLLLLIIIAFVLPLFVPKENSVPIPLDTTTRTALNSIEKTGKAHPAGEEDYRSYAFEAPENRYDPTAGALFLFDPNTLDESGWRSLGLPNRAIRTIDKYRSKGGRFYRPEDLAKIYSLPPGFYERVKGHIRIARPEYKTFDDAALPAEKYVKSAPSIIDINTADTTAFIALPGIGSRLAARIVNFRNKLGGFYSIAQVGETYGVPDSTFQRIKERLVVNENALQKININAATKEALSAHPYIDWKIANAIVAYREQHGAYESVEDLKKIMILDDATIGKMKPYLAVQ